MPVLLLHPRSEQYQLSLGYLGHPNTPVLLIHPRSEQYYLSLRHLGISQYVQLWQHFSCMYVYILLSGAIVLATWWDISRLFIHLCTSRIYPGPMVSQIIWFPHLRSQNSDYVVVDRVFGRTERKWYISHSKGEIPNKSVFNIMIL